MTPSRDASTPGREVEVAIGRVLAAERDARDAVAVCERSAEALRVEARAADKRIAERAATRSAAIRSGMAAKLAARLARFGAEGVAVERQAGPDPTAAQRLDAAVARLADELAGSMP